MKYLKVLTLFIIMGMLQGWPTPDNEVFAGELLINNNSNETIYFYDSFSPTEVNINDVSLTHLKNQRLVSKNSKKIKVYKYLFGKGEKLYLLIFKQSTLDNYTWEEIQKNNMYDELYVLALEDLENMNWEIVYNGN